MLSTHEVVNSAVTVEVRPCLECRADVRLCRSGAVRELHRPQRASPIVPTELNSVSQPLRSEQVGAQQLTHADPVTQ